MDILDRGECGEECVLTCERPEVIVFGRGKFQRATGEWGRERELMPEKIMTLGWCWCSRLKLLGTWDSPGHVLLVFTSSVRICVCL